MTGAAILEAFAAVGVELLPSAGQVVYRAPFGKVSAALRAALRDNEVEVLGLLAGISPVAPAGSSGAVQTAQSCGTVPSPAAGAPGPAPFAAISGSSEPPAAACVQAEQTNGPDQAPPFAECSGRSKTPAAPRVATTRTREAEGRLLPTACSLEQAATTREAEVVAGVSDAVKDSAARAPGACHCCGGSEFWRSRWVERICCKCHPRLGTPERREAYEERAAILEHDAKLPRTEAERLAKEMV